MHQAFSSLIKCFSFVILVFQIVSAGAITIPTVTVGNPGNALDSTGFGAVSYSYNIGTTEVTNAQYAAFLNEKAKSDPLFLYNTNMGFNDRGGITRSGTDGSYSYVVRNNMSNKPVNYVSWFDAIRFANWLNNGQGAGDTESGAYTILGGTFNPSNGTSIIRNPGATWFLTSEDEWYKAAYHQPAVQGGDSDNYWDYPTATNSVPTIALANLVGDISNPGPNVANYNQGADWNGLDGNVTTVGSAGLLSNSFYGTSDQGGNVSEWTERQSTITATSRSSRGGAFNFVASGMQATNEATSSATTEVFGRGFRVANVAMNSGSGADFDNDGDVDGRDFLVWQRGDSTTPLSAADLAAWQSNYGTPFSAAVKVVPEPLGIILFVVALPELVAILSRRQHGSMCHRKKRFMERPHMTCSEN